MFENILDILNELNDLPFVIVHKIVEHLIENNDNVRLIKVKVYKLYEDEFYSLIYKANFKENNPDDYLKMIYEQLMVIRKKFIKRVD